MMKSLITIAARTVSSLWATEIDTHIERHLERAGGKYLDSINDTRPESTIAMMDRLSPLLQYVHDGDTVVSIGVGSGEEVCGLWELFGDSIQLIGLDIAPTALDKTKLRVMRNNFAVELLKADATCIPLSEASVNAVVLSSTLHEIFSYHEDGLAAFKTCLSEVARVLKPGGVVFVRDFAALDVSGQVTLQVRTPLAMKFYEAFRTSFRRFPLWDGKMDHLKLTDEYLPPIGSGVVHMPAGKAAELLMHFRSFWSDYQSGISALGDPYWKEADEMYHVQIDGKVLDPDEYLQLIEDSLGSSFTLVLRKLRDRGKTVAFLNRHFALRNKSNPDLIPQTARKLECVLQKDATVLRHYAAAVLFDGEGRILLCKRASYKKIAPNMWHLPGGAIELNENPIETVNRELKEELDLNVSATLPTRVRFTYTVDGGYHQTHVFLVEAPGQNPVLKTEENSEIRFVTIEELSRLIEPHLVEDNLRAVKAARVLKGEGI